MDRSKSERFREQNPEVLYSEAAITVIDRSDIDLLKQLSSGNARKRSRICAHLSPENPLHEMLIVHERGGYIRPHKHPGKTESTHIIEGVVDVVVFDDDGHVNQVIRMGDYASGNTFYFRMASQVFHTLIIRSEILVFHETTNGPFDRRDTVFAPWSPEGDDEDAATAFLADLEHRMGHQ